jgi:predicted transcriptional regulator
MKLEKRHKLQLYYEILVAIEGHMNNGGYSAAKPTHVQQSTRLSYDKMINHFDELEEKGIIVYRRNIHEGLISITHKGKLFVQQYNKLVTLIESAGL